MPPLRAVYGDLSGAKRLVMAAGSASKRRALAELGSNIPLHPLGQRKGVDVSADPTALPSLLMVPLASCTAGLRASSSGALSPHQHYLVHWWRTYCTTSVAHAASGGESVG